MSIQDIVSSVSEEKVSQVKANVSSLQQDEYSADASLIMMAYE